MKNLLVVWLLFVSLLAPLASGQEKATTAANPRPSMPAYRVENEGFAASEGDIRAVCNSAGGELWRYFPDYELEPFVITRGHEGPVVLFDRNADGEIVMRLDTEKTYWCQYAYQFAHEFCHLLAGYDRDGRETKWFEESLCETASMFAMRAMARSWKQNPPYSNWKDYRDWLRTYIDDVIAERQEVDEIFRNGLPEFYRTHQEELRQHPNRRNLNGSIAVVLLRLFEAEPERWETVRWLNHTPSPPRETFPEYLQKWHDAVPERHQPFVTEIGQLFGIPLEAAQGNRPACP